MFSHYQVIFQKQILGLIEFEDLVIDSGLEAKALVKWAVQRHWNPLLVYFLRLNLKTEKSKCKYIMLEW